LRGECGQDQDRSDNRYRLKDHDETTLSLSVCSSLCGVNAGPDCRSHA
jgi:hypothetical protein